jgi:hypothetical protein
LGFHVFCTQWKGIHKSQITISSYDIKKMSEGSRHVLGWKFYGVLSCDLYVELKKSICGSGKKKKMRLDDLAHEIVLELQNVLQDLNGVEVISYYSEDDECYSYAISVFDIQEKLSVDWILDIDDEEMKKQKTKLRKVTEECYTKLCELAKKHNLDPDDFFEKRPRLIYISEEENAMRDESYLI